MIKTLLDLAEAKRATFSAKRWAAFAVAVNLLNFTHQIAHLAYKYHWWGLGG